MSATPLARVAPANLDRAPPRAPAWPLDALRIYIGAVFVVAGTGELLGRAPWGEAADWPRTLATTLAAYGAHTWPVYQPLLRDVLLPHRALIAAIVPWTNLAVGVLLVVGVGVRAVATIAVLLLVQYMALMGTRPWGPQPQTVLAMLAFTVILGAGARSGPARSGADGSRRTAARWTVVPLRIYIGLAFLLPLAHRVVHSDDWLREVREFLAYAQTVAAAGDRPLLAHVAMPHVTTFAVLVAVGEALVGGALLAGARTRAAAVGGMFLSVNYWLAKGDPPLAVQNDQAFIAAMLVLFAMRAGAVWGVDGWLARRRGEGRRGEGEGDAA